MDSSDKLAVCFLVTFLVFVGLVFICSCWSQANDNTYRLEALEAAKGCEPCQVMLIAQKGA